MRTATKPVPLSPRMVDFCRAVETLTERRGIPPSLTEIAQELRVHPSRAQKLALDAEARGAIVREPRIPRSMRVATPKATTKPSTTRRTAK